MKFNYTNRLNHTLERGKLNFLLDSCAGSAGKAKLESFLVKNSNYTFLATSNSANASHTVVDGDVEFIFKALPSGSLYHDKLEAIYIVSGAAFEIKSLMEEIDFCKIPRSKIRISPRASVIQQIDKDFEKGECDLDGNYYQKDELRDGTVKTGTTASGSGTVLAKKTVRNKTLVTAKDCPEIADMVCVVEEEILQRLERGESGLFSIGQGFPLSNNYWRFAPHTTARNVTVSAALNDAFLPPLVAGNVFLNDRTYPIRIASYKFISQEKEITTMNWDVISSSHYGEVKEYNLVPDNEKKDIIQKYFGNYDSALFEIREKKEDATFIGFSVVSKSNVHLTKPQMDRYPEIPAEKINSYSGDFFPDQEEITWQEVMDKADVVIPEKVMLTTLTKLPRRIATYSKLNLEEGIRYNRTAGKMYVSINFVNWIDNEMTASRDFITGKARVWLEENMKPVVDKFSNVQLMFLGTSEMTDDCVVIENSL